VLTAALVGLLITAGVVSATQLRSLLRATDYRSLP